MNILLLTSEFPPKMRGGLANYSYNLVKYLERNSCVKVAVLPSDPTFRRYTENLRYVYEMWRIIKKSKKHEKLEVVYSITFQPQFSAIGFYTKLVNIPFVSHGVGLDVYTQQPSSVLARRIAYSVSKQLICGTNFQKKLMLREGASAEKISAVLGGVDTQIFRPLHKERTNLLKFFGLEGKFVLLSLGRLMKRKGFDNAIKALTYLDDIEDILLLIVGKGPEETSLRRKVRALSLEKKIRFLGFVKSGLLPKIYNIADVFIAPFKIIGRDMEGFPLVVQEAQACGVPVVTTNTTGVPELIENGKTGYVVRMNSTEEIAEKVRMLYEDPRLRNNLSRNARKRAEKLLDWRVSIAKIENILRVALAQQ